MDVQLRRKKILHLWYTIQDLIGNASQWPKKNERSVLERKPKPLNSSLSFCFPESYKPRYFFFEWVDVYRMCDNEKRHEAHEGLIQYWTILNKDATFTLCTHGIPQKKTKRLFHECWYVYWSVYIIILGQPHQISRKKRTYLFPPKKTKPLFPGRWPQKKSPFLND